MAGLYVHIPFCRDACIYCDFHFSISLGHLHPMLEAIVKEIAAERDFLDGEGLETIYLGGGTPSILKPAELNRIFHAIRNNFKLHAQAEITLEANPDDISPAYLSSLKKIGVNRLSIGIQSFRDEDLKFMNRGHTSRQAECCLEYALRAGFDNLNLDLIYGLPGQRTSDWLKNLEKALVFEPKHLAAYHLSYEPGSVLDYRRRKARLKPLEEERSLEQYILLVEQMENCGYQHYEISNFARPGYISRHNSAYWTGKKYLGVGPSAHSYNGRTRRWNMTRNTSYIKGIMEGNTVFEEEQLDEKSRFHDYLMTSLRTSQGIDTGFIKREWGNDYYEHTMEQSLPHIRNGKLFCSSERLVLTTDGMFIADHVIRDLFL